MCTFSTEKHSLVALEGSKEPMTPIKTCFTGPFHFCFSVLTLEHRALHIAGDSSTTESYPSVRMKASRGWGGFFLTTSLILTVRLI